MAARPDNMGLHIIVTGNPVDGFEYVGPFATGAEAVEWADRDARIDADWWIAPLEAKSEFERQDFTGTTG